MCFKLFLFSLVVLACVSCKPSYFVVHKGHGVFTDSVTLHYHSGNILNYAN